MISAAKFSMNASILSVMFDQKLVLLTNLVFGFFKMKALVNLPEVI
jgi:hypothetical protein